MTTFQTSISIAAPREAVWRVLADVAAWPKWLPTVASVESLDGNPLVLGNRYRVRQPRLQPVTWTVTELEPSSRFSWQARTPGLRMSADHMVSGDSSGKSDVVLRFSFAGPLGPLVGAVYRAITERYMATEAAKLKQKVETSR
ncbi:MAG TPA: SRPBCC family protein [Methylomirabilota bacterium]|jgi:uncharacterized membrane protein|nr:SRPBCC family protein [Methylomirabilota bacterium]